MRKVLNLSKAAKAIVKPGSMIEIVEKALRQATWDATQGPDYLRTGRFDPEPPKRSEKTPGKN